MRSCMHSLSRFIIVGGHGLGDSSSLFMALVAWRVGFFLTDGAIRVLSVTLLCFQVDVGRSVRESLCAHTHIHARTAYRVLDVSPRVKTRHLKSLKNPNT